MIILNTTFVLNNLIAPEVVTWIRDSYLASALHCGADAAACMLTRVLVSPDPETVTYALHAAFNDMSQAEKWNLGVAEKLRGLMSRRWGENALAFFTYLETVE